MPSRRIELPHQRASPTGSQSGHALPAYVSLILIERPLSLNNRSYAQSCYCNFSRLFW